MTFLQTGKGPIEIRELSSLAEMLAAEKIQTEVWGADTIPVSKEMLIPIQHEGGLLAAAFASGGEMVGLVFGFPTNDASVQHSHILATREDWRGQGIGTALKWFQRLLCLDRGIRQVRWTVDPLRAANAELNIRHLGATSSQYFVDYYGPTQGIDAGAPTDRLLMDWDLTSERVAARAVRPPEDRGFPEAQAANEVDRGEPVDPKVDLTGPEILIRLPENFMKTSRVDPGSALRWRLQTRDLFLHYFAAGYAITEFTRVGGPAYLLRKGGLISG